MLQERTQIHDVLALLKDGYRIIGTGMDGRIPVWRMTKGYGLIVKHVALPKGWKAPK